jgi:hypothetical protein
VQALVERDCFPISDNSTGLGDELHRFLLLISGQTYRRYSKRFRWHFGPVVWQTAFVDRYFHVVLHWRLHTTLPRTGGAAPPGHGINWDLHRTTENRKKYSNISHPTTFYIVPERIRFRRQRFLRPFLPWIFTAVVFLWWAVTLEFIQNTCQNFIWKSINRDIQKTNRKTL